MKIRPFSEYKVGDTLIIPKGLNAIINSCSGTYVHEFKSNLGAVIHKTTKTSLYISITDDYMSFSKRFKGIRIPHTEIIRFNADLELNISDVSDSKIQKVKAIKDESGHWYVIPNDLVSTFRKDEQDEDFVDSGEFDNKYGKYRTGGDLNLVQLWAEL